MIAIIALLQGCTNAKKAKETQTTSTKNRLATASSPYLRMHDTNPVDWYEWGEEAFAKAEKENKPLLISVGYSSCHWCHVMAEESFSDSTVAKLMNEKFVNIKVDREERPDVDKIYMDAAVLINGSGGWPLNAFAMPDGSPFHAGTYFEKTEWINLLNTLSDVYNSNPDAVKSQSELLKQGISSRNAVVINENKTSKKKEVLSNALRSIVDSLDLKNGGLQGAPKFPMPSLTAFLMQSEKALGLMPDEVQKSLDALLAGGIHDQLGGGFHRYTVDDKWFIPHFEKMLYDNAQLLQLYSKAYKKYRDPGYFKVINSTASFLSNELRNEDGLFISSLNAVSEGEEGAYYVWGFKELQNLLNVDELDFAIDHYNVRPEGNWEDRKNILSKELVQSRYKDSAEDSLSVNAELEKRVKNKLLAARNLRARPAEDQKVITGWNSLTISAFCEAYTATGNQEYLNIALQAASSLERMMVKDRELRHSFYDGQITELGFADDYAFYVQALIDLYTVTFEKKYLDEAKQWTDIALARFTNNASPLLNYSSAELAVGLNSVEIDDGVIPSSNAVFALNLFKLGEYFQNADYLKLSEEMVMAVSSEVKSANAAYYTKWLKLLQWMDQGTFEVAIVGPKALKLSTKLQGYYLSNIVVMGGNEENLPLLEYKKTDTTLIYVCRNRSCKLPVETVEEALQLMAN